MPIVIISGHGNIEIAVAAIKQGAYDFIEKPFNIDQLMVVIGRALETSRLRRENAQLKGRGKDCDDRRQRRLPQMKNQLDKVARTNSRVMLTGPAGSGKEVAARYLHRNSSGPRARSSRLTRPRSRRPDGGGAVRSREPRARGSRGSSSGPTPASCSSTARRTCRRDAIEDPAGAGRPGLPAGRRHPR